MMYAKVKLFPPSSPETEVLSGIADRRGFFCFMPDEAGEWRLEAEDGMGHKGTIAIRAGAPGASGESAGSSPPGGKPSRLFAAVFGASLIFNIFALWYGAAALNRKKSHAH
jgi:nickel transport protein